MTIFRDVVLPRLLVTLLIVAGCDGVSRPGDTLGAQSAGRWEWHGRIRVREDPKLTVVRLAIDTTAGGGDVGLARYDFNPAEGDTIDLGALLLKFTDFAGGSVQDAMDQGFLYVQDNGAPGYPSCTVYIDRNGDAPDNFVPGGDIAVVGLSGVNAADITADCFLMNTLSNGTNHFQAALQTQYFMAV